MKVFVNVIKEDPQVRIKIFKMLDGYNLLPYNYQSKIGYDTLIENVILKQMINIVAATITDLDIELKRKNSTLRYLEIKLV